MTDTRPETADERLKVSDNLHGMTGKCPSMHHQWTKTSRQRPKMDHERPKTRNKRKSLAYEQPEMKSDQSMTHRNGQPPTNSVQLCAIFNHCLPISSRLGPICNRLSPSPNQ